LNELAKISGFAELTKGVFEAFKDNMFTFSKFSSELALYLVIKDWPRIGDSSGELT